MIGEVGKQMITLSLVVTSTFHLKGMHACPLDDIQARAKLKKKDNG